MVKLAQIEKKMEKLASSIFSPINWLLILDSAAVQKGKKDMTERFKNQLN